MVIVFLDAVRRIWIALGKIEGVDKNYFELLLVSLCFGFFFLGLIGEVIFYILNHEGNKYLSLIHI